MHWPGCETRQVSVVSSPFPKITHPQGKLHHSKVTPSIPSSWLDARPCWCLLPGPEIPVGPAEPACAASHPSPSLWTLVFDLLPIQEELLDFPSELEADLSSCVWHGGVQWLETETRRQDS